MEALGIIIFIIIFIVQTAQKLAQKGKEGTPTTPNGPWKRAGEHWPDPGQDWQWDEEEEEKEWTDRDYQPEVVSGPAARQLMDDNSVNLFKDRHSSIKDGKQALIREEEVARRPVEMAAPSGEAAEAFTPQQLVQGVIFAEIIGPPRARRSLVKICRN
ncbi:MAG: hypothetical protein M0Z31_02685 [Clostridia bacterium]|nr:hypothetical protein [Clostridia bacterium]